MHGAMHECARVHVDMMTSKLPERRCFCGIAQLNHPVRAVEDVDAENPPRSKRRKTHREK